LTANYPNPVFTTWADGPGGDTYAASILNLIQDDVTAIVADAQLGWLRSRVAWTYASATTFTCPGDYTLVFHKGTKLLWTQTTAKYAYVQSVSYSAPNTTVTINGGSDYTVANAAVVNPYYSYAARPQGFPDWFNWTGVPTGFSTVPAAANFFRFRTDGLACRIAFDTGTGGTSDATDFGLNLPIPAATVSSWLANWETPMTACFNNGTLLPVACRASISEGGTAVSFYTDCGTALWTAANNKRARASMVYEY